MKRILTKKQNGFLSRLVFFIAGLLATGWVLIRVVQKPSRIYYPCMRTAAPVMTGFLIYLAGLSGLTIIVKKTRAQFRMGQYSRILWAVPLGMSLVFLTIIAWNPLSSAKSAPHALLEDPNMPVGIPEGYWAGRVTWVMDKDATDSIAAGEKWYQNTNLAAVRNLLANGIKRYTDTTNLATAWNCLFSYFNEVHGKGWKGYTQGEKIVIKLNTTNLGAGGHNLSDLMNSTPELVLALLEELIDTVGVAQSDITIGDPFRGFPDQYWNLCHGKYPNVHYVEGSASAGREQTTVTSQDLFFTSDNQFSSRIPSFYVNASYLINMPCLKTHNSAGITLAAKNHQGSVIGTGQTPQNQLMVDFLHYDYPDQQPNQTMGIYRHLVDYMAHSKMGGNTLVYIIDGIWAGRNWNGYVDRFGLSPFNGDYPSSLFISQDPVAIESVCFDFLREEYMNYPGLHGNDDFPLWEGVQDYIHQAADPAQWPLGISYDPDHADHSHPIGSLGVHEHWNNADQKEYSVNLTGEKGGIDLVSFPKNLVPSVPLKYNHEMNPTGISNLNLVSPKIFPNPCSENFILTYSIPTEGMVSISLWSANGKKVADLQENIHEKGPMIHEFNIQLPGGIYFCRLNLHKGSVIEVVTTRLIVN